MNPNNLPPELTNTLKSISPIDVRAALFKQGNFDFICTGKDEEGKIVTHHKQKQALEILTSNKYEEFLYGGAAGGAKSWTGCAWIMFMAICYPGTKYFIARNELGDITDSVLVTWNKVCRAYGFTDWKYNGQKNFISLGNGSHINLIEVKYKPSDPMYEDVGSTEYTAGWIEEVGEIHEMAATVLSSRVGRHMNSKYGIKGVVFYTCNPKKNWAKMQFYDKDRRGTLEKDKFFLQCLVTENPFIESEYVDKLRRMAQKNKAMYERLFKGNWEYEDNPNALCHYEMIEQVFSNDHVEEGKLAYLTADIARLGSDKAVIMVWKGWKVVEVITYDVSKTTELTNRIILLRKKYHIPKSRCIADEDGIGGAIVDDTGIVGFRNNGTPIKESGDMPNYRNLQVQCLYHLADRVNEAKLWIACDLTQRQQEEIMEELDQIQSKLSEYGKHDVKHKGDIKEDIGRSPDYRDALLMRVYFDLKPTIRKLITARARKVL